MQGFVWVLFFFVFFFNPSKRWVLLISQTIGDGNSQVHCSVVWLWRAPMAQHRKPLRHVQTLPAKPSLWPGLYGTYPVWGRLSPEARSPSAHSGWTTAVSKITFFQESRPRTSAWSFSGESLEVHPGVTETHWYLGAVPRCAFRLPSESRLRAFCPSTQKHRWTAQNKEIHTSWKILCPDLLGNTRLASL